MCTGRLELCAAPAPRRWSTASGGIRLSSLRRDNVSVCAGKELPKGFVARVRTRKAGMSQVRCAVRACLPVAPRRRAVYLHVLYARVCVGCWLTIDSCLLADFVRDCVNMHAIVG